MQLEQVVPWGRNASEYLRMFDLRDDDLAGRILGCGDGPASFNAELTAAGRQVISIDPIYAFPAEGIRARVATTYDAIIGQVKLHPERYLWREFADPDALGATRLAAMERFLIDYDTGKAEGRYLEGALPSLPFAGDSFDLALCSHLLFLYSEQLDADFHVAAAAELLRVARDVRCFPLLNLECELSAHLSVVIEWCRAAGHEAEVRPVPYEFQVGGAMMLHLRRNHSAVAQAA
jgi:SAM-dependent methyltransferase